MQCANTIATNQCTACVLSVKRTGWLVPDVIVLSHAKCNWQWLNGAVAGALRSNRAGPELYMDFTLATASYIGCGTNANQQLTQIHLHTHAHIKQYQSGFLHGTHTCLWDQAPESIKGLNPCQEFSAKRIVLSQSGTVLLRRYCLDIFGNAFVQSLRIPSRWRVNGYLSEYYYNYIK